MTNDPSNIIAVFVLSLLVGSLLVDFVLDAIWNKKYFTSGLMIFVKRIPVNHWHTNIPQQAILEKEFHSVIVSSLSFKEIDAFSYGFREKLFQFKWIRTPDLMHGLLIFDTNSNQVVVKGFANWFTLAFSLLLLSLPVSGIVRIVLGKETLSSLFIALGGTGLFFLVLGIMYLFQFSRFSNVASFAAQSWERKYIRDGNEA